MCYAIFYDVWCCSSKMRAKVLPGELHPLILHRNRIVNLFLDWIEKIWTQLNISLCNNGFKIEGLPVYLILIDNNYSKSQCGNALYLCHVLPFKQGLSHARK